MINGNIRLCLSLVLFCFVGYDIRMIFFYLFTFNPLHLEVSDSILRDSLAKTT